MDRPVAFSADPAFGADDSLDDEHSGEDSIDDNFSEDDDDDDGYDDDQNSDNIDEDSREGLPRQDSLMATSMDDSDTSDSNVISEEESGLSSLRRDPPPIIVSPSFSATHAELRAARHRSFRILESFYCAIEELSFPFPVNFHTWFITMGFHLLPERYNLSMVHFAPFSLSVSLPDLSYFCSEYLCSIWMRAFSE
jgi:hypothetical protein